YRKVEFRAYDISAHPDFTEQNMIGSTSLYILCPGGDGQLPTVTFTGADPTILYYKGPNHYIVTETNFNMLEVTNRYNLMLKSTEPNGKTYDIPSGNIFFPEGPAGNIMDIVLDGEYALGSYNLYVEWTEVAVNDGIVTNETKSQTAPALNITFTDDTSYKNDSYGILIVYQDKSSAPDQKYYIKNFRGESQYGAFKNAANPEYSKILLEFRGEFVIDTYVNGSPTSWTATSLSAGNNVVSLNNCLDFENGVLQVHYANNIADSGSIQVDFDGALYTSDARTSIWTGKAALTEIENGEEYSLMRYNQNGTRDPNFKDNTITLVWPALLSIAQKLCGLVFNFTYGELGVMKDDKGKEIGRVLAFTANMKLDFLIPSGVMAEGIEEDSTWKRVKSAFDMKALFKEYDYRDLRTRMASIVAESANTDEEKDALEEASGQLSVMVKDILFGCGQGFIGFNTAMNLTLPAYTESMPKMNCKLSINTIGNWSFGVEGSAKFSNLIELEFEIDIKSYNNIPVLKAAYVKV
ncbi:MAG TPA: hypothetical protein GX532_08095, partial [Clostridia bacterium]|nr:hypothetical protein [Clostridia bacterium]